MTTHSDWLTLVVLDGLVVSEPVLEERFPGGPPVHAQGTYHWFRRRAEKYRVSQTHPNPERRVDGAREWLDFLLVHLLGHPPGAWLRGHGPGAADVPRVRLDDLDQELVPDRVLMGAHGPVLLVSVVPPDQGLDRRDRQPGRWKASPTTKLDRLLRGVGVPLGLVTNGSELRLLFSPPGLNTGSITWTSRMLIEERATLDAFAALLGQDSLTPARAEDLTLLDLCRLSQDRQVEVADQLGVQVRNGLEKLILAWDDADRHADGALLRGMTEDQIYEMGLAVMMRLVFLLYAEERSLLPHGEVLYDQGYGLTFLWHRLQHQRHEDPARLNQTHDAWDRFLATCRLVHGGCRHPDLSLIAYGGSLFDPARFPALESPACRISNRVMDEVLHLLLFARQRKGGQPQRVGYWAVDVEQIGYIYEGLLDHRCARAGDVPRVKLRGGGEEAWDITELDQLDREKLCTFVSQRTGRKPEAVETALDEPLVDDPAIEKLQHFPPAVVERLRPFAAIIQCDEVVPPGWRYLTTGTSRRASGAHYTPQSLTERIVRVTLEPLVFRCQEGCPGLLLEPREVKTPRELLALKVCDIAMGSGAFLVQAVRYLGERLVEAWDRALAGVRQEGELTVLTMPFADNQADGQRERPIDPEKRDEMVLWARRFVVERCIYGVDVNPLAVEMAKLSLWLTTLAKDRPFTFLDHALRCGDSLVGIDAKQLQTWSLDGEGSGDPLLVTLVREKVKEALEARQALQAITVIDVTDHERKYALLARAERALARVRIVGDLVVAPYFAAEKRKDREVIRNRLLDRFTLARTDEHWAELEAEARALLGDQRTFHWPFEFPEVFPVNGPSGFEAIVGNPPYIGGQFIRRQLGEHALLWFRERWPQSHGTADLVAFFFLRAFENLRPGGIFGLIATNTIAQGDTRESGLDVIEKDGGRIFSAVYRTPWQGHAAVNVSVVHVARGDWAGPHVLDGRQVARISTSLDDADHALKPFPLGENQDRSFIGSYVLGLGFTMSPEEANDLIARDPRNAEVLQPYLNGKDLNTSWDQSPTRWVINFRDWSIEHAQEFPDLFRIVKEKVFPERQKLSRAPRRDRWWRFAETAVSLYRSIEGLDKVLVVARTTKHLGFALVANKQVFDVNLVIFGLGDPQHYSSLQSSVHDAWVKQTSSTLDTRQGYRPSDCFETFPFPIDLAPLNDVGLRYHGLRQAIMESRREGLTKTYNRFHNRDDRAADIQKLRDLHVEMDRAVANAYGWTDLDLGHGWVKTVTTEEVQNKRTGKVETVEQEEWRFTISDEARREVLRRLLALNHERHQQELASEPPMKARPSKPPTRDPRRKPSDRPVEARTRRQTGLLFDGFGETRDEEQEQARAAESSSTYRPSPSTPPSADADPLLAYLQANPDWHGKAEILAATGLGESTWIKTIQTLLDCGKVEREGVKRGTRYRATR